MKYLGIDYGTKRTGLAVSDPEERFAFPRATLSMTTREAFFASLLAFIEKEGIGGIVIGLPLLTDGSEQLTTRQARHFAERLKRRTDKPIFWMEEVLSSFEAEEDLRLAGRTDPKDRALIDQQAAARILQSFLNQPAEKRRPA